MLRIVTGRFHPDLDTALVEDIRSLKSSDPLAPVAIVVPSEPLRRWLQRFLCLDHQLALLDVHFLTFHQLAWHLAREHQAITGRDDTRLDVVGDLFFSGLLKHIHHRMPALRRLGLSGLTLGGWSALWRTVRDLKDAMVEPEVALRAVADGVFAEDGEALRDLFTLYAAVQEAGRALRIGSADDLAATVIPTVPHSAFLARLARVYYYGFYDLTQVQLSFFEAVVRTVPATLYFPLTDRPAYGFARRFFERHVARLAPTAEPVQYQPPSDGLPRNGRTPGRQIASVIGTDEELVLVCKEILTLVETNGYRFEEIGVVARTLEPYRTSLARVFERHRIPFVTPAAVPLLREPAAKAVLALARLPQSRFDRTLVLDVLTASCYRQDRVRRPDVEPRPDLWRLAVHSLGITRGEDEWRRLTESGPVEVLVGRGDETEAEPNGRAGGLSIPEAQLRLLADLVAGLVQDLATLPREGRVGTLTDAFRDVVIRHLAIPGLCGGEEENAGLSDRLHRIGRAIAGALRQVRELDRLGETVIWEEWGELFAQAMEAATVPIEPGDHAGVFVLDAMDARGLSFRALFVMGLNETVFPRTIREDAFLRDRHRRALAETLGYKVDEKLGGYEEERLLFALLEDAAHERLYLSFQRADADGRPLAVSSYLEPDLRDDDGRPQPPDVILPRRLSDRLRLRQFAPSLLTWDELGLGLSLTGQASDGLLEATGRSGLLFRQGVSFVQDVEGPSRALGWHDGRTGPIGRHWAAIVERGLTPTELEGYARCPFQYFAEHVLRIQPIRQRPHDDLPASVLGKLCHETLRASYERLLRRGWPDAELSSGELCATIESAAEAAGAACMRMHGSGYPLLWQLARETIVRVILEFLANDQKDCRESGFRPAAFEVEADGSLEAVDTRAFAGLRVHGRLDRVDRRQAPPGLRVVDYKYRIRRTMKGEDRDLLVSAVRGLRLQPPLYSVMQPKGLPDLPPTTVEFVFLAPRWNPPVERSSFAPSVWAEPAGRQLVATLRMLIEGVRDGIYVVLPGDYCDECAYASACRRFHGPTWWRAHLSAQAKGLRRIRKQKVDKP